MADEVQFALPDFLEGQDADTIHRQMLAHVPDEFDKSEGGFVWDMTYPTAIEKAQAAQYLIPEALRSMFPLWASGQMLDMHGANRGIVRRGAQRAECILTFSGADGTVIPAGTAASTVATSDVAAVVFRTVDEVVIAGGAASVRAQAVQAGQAGNAAAGSVCRMDAPVSGVVSVTNQAAQGGVDQEPDEQLRQRIVEFDAAQGRNYVGSAADYRRWALEVSGVGTVKVLAASDDSGMITLIITNSAGSSAPAELCQAVNDHIMRPDDPEQRLAPINAQLTVITPEELTIAVAAKVTLDGTDLATVTTALVQALEDYFAAIDDGVVRLTRVGALLLGIEGVEDYSGLTLGGAAANVTLTDMQLPRVMASEVKLT